MAVWTRLNNGDNMDGIDEFLKLRKLKSDIEKLGNHKRYAFELMFDSDHLDNSQMAELCKCSVPVIRNYMRVISRLFGVKDRWELILLCLDLDKVDRIGTIFSRYYVETMIKNPIKGSYSPGERLPATCDFANVNWETVIEFQKSQMRNKVRKFDERLTRLEEEHGLCQNWKSPRKRI